MRLQRFLASCGLGSRRACEALIDRGLVAVDGEIVQRQGVVIDPESQVVTVEGKRIAPERHGYLLLNKPVGVLCTSDDPEGRTTFLDLLPDEWRQARLYTVGRLDRDSEGLLLITNDGDLTHRLTHPRHHIRKIYHVWVSRPLTGAERETVLQGVWCRGEKLRALAFRPARALRDGAHYEVELGEGRNRHIRHMLECIGVRVARLRRVAMGPLHLGRLKPGASRPLDESEIRALHKAAGLTSDCASQNDP